MKHGMGVGVLIVAFLFALGVGPVFAWNCPTLIKANADMIKGIKGAKGDAKKSLDQATRLNGEADKLHKAGKHDESIAASPRIIGGGSMVRMR